MLERVEVVEVGVVKESDGEERRTALEGEWYVKAGAEGRALVSRLCRAALGWWLWRLWELNMPPFVCSDSSLLSWPVPCSETADRFWKDETG